MNLCAVFQTYELATHCDQPLCQLSKVGTFTPCPSVPRRQHRRSTLTSRACQLRSPESNRIKGIMRPSCRPPHYLASKELNGIEPLPRVTGQLGFQDLFVPTVAKLHKEGDPLFRRFLIPSKQPRQDLNLELLFNRQTCSPFTLQGYITTVGSFHPPQVQLRPLWYPHSVSTMPAVLRGVEPRLLT